ncbi:MAG: type II secretion system protein [Pseudomonadales bacterium]
MNRSRRSTGPVAHKGPIRSALSRGFTLIELLIVAIMLAILAAIIVPQFSGTTDGAAEAALRSDLAGMRSAIALYRQQHGAFPGEVASTGGTCTGGTAGSGGAESVAAINEQLGLYSNASGQTCTLPVGGNFPFGPYLGQVGLPDNAVTNSNTVVIIGAAATTAGDLTMAGDGAGGGWKYDVTSGKLIANDTNPDQAGVRFDAY